MDVVGHQTSVVGSTADHESAQPAPVDGRPTGSASAPPHRRFAILALLTAFALATLVVVEAGSPAAIGADTTTSSTIAGPLVPLQSFPVQGKCYFADTYGAARSGGRLHEGVDLIAKSGQFVYAVADGTLTKKYVDTAGSLSGNGWRLTSPGGTYFFYAHFSGFPAGLAVGSKVVAGQIIGYVGETGNAGMPHLHFEIHPGGGAAVNPTKSVGAIDGCAVTAIPTVATNPTSPPAPRDSPAAATTTPPTLALAVRIPVNESAEVPATTVAPVVTPPTAPPAPIDSSANGRWEFIEPVVVLNGSGPTALAAGVTRQVEIAGVSGLTASPAAVMVRASATASTAGTVVVHPCSGAVPDTSTLSVESGPMAIGTAMVEVQLGKICVTSSVAASVKLTATAQVAPGAAGLRPMPATRVLDSRPNARLAANQMTTISLATLGVAPTAKAVTATFTIVAPSSAGTMLISACGGTEVKAPFTSSPLSAFSLVVPVNGTGLCATSTVATDLVIDVDGAWEGDAPPIVAVRPVRVLSAATTAAPTAIAVAGIGGLPATVTSANVQITVTAAARAASVFVWACDQPQPAASVGVVGASRKASFIAASAVSAGQICIATNEAATTLVDVSGVN